MHPAPAPANYKGKNLHTHVKGSYAQCASRTPKETWCHGSPARPENCLLFASGWRLHLRLRLPAAPRLPAACLAGCAAITKAAQLFPQLRGKMIHISLCHTCTCSYNCSRQRPVWTVLGATWQCWKRHVPTCPLFNDSFCCWLEQFHSHDDAIKHPPFTECSSLKQFRQAVVSNTIVFSRLLCVAWPVASSWQAQRVIALCLCSKDWCCEERQVPSLQWCLVLSSRRNMGSGSCPAMGMCIAVCTC